MFYAPPPADEVTVNDKWDYLITVDPVINGERHFRRGQGVRVHKNHITLRHVSYDWIPDEQAINELKALMTKWREAGMGGFADAVETREVNDGEEYAEESIYDSLGHSKETVSYSKVPIKKVRFFKEKPYDPSRGLAEIIREPRSNARIVGLNVAPN